MLPSVFNISAQMSLYLKDFLLTVLYKTADPTLSRSYFSVLLYFPPFYLSALEGSSPVTGRDIVLCALRRSLEPGRFGTSYDGETVAYSVFSLLKGLGVSLFVWKTRPWDSVSAAAMNCGMKEFLGIVLQKKREEKKKKRMIIVTDQHTDPHYAWFMWWIQQQVSLLDQEHWRGMH